MSERAPAGVAYRYPEGIRGALAKISDQFSSSSAAGVAMPCGTTLSEATCAQLADRQTEYASAQERAALASAVYDNPPAESVGPYSLASDDDLRALGLLDPRGRKLTEIPNSNFGSAVYRDQRTGRFVIAFKGSEPKAEDWVTNAGQGLGQDTAYYSRAIKIARTAGSQAPGMIEFAGHSLGGGLASAAAAASGAPATTFNAAGLHPATLEREALSPQRRPTNVSAYYVEGEVLSTLQDSLPLPDAAGERRPLPSHSTWTEDGVSVLAGVMGSAAGPAGSIAAFLTVRSALLHRMSAVDRSISAQRDGVAALQRLRGCPQ